MDIQNPNRKNAKNTQNTQNTPITKVFRCEPCEFIACKESNFNAHLSTKKHEILTAPNEKMPNSEHMYDCVCGKLYKHLSSLCAHKKICQIIEMNNISTNLGEIKIQDDTNNNKEIINFLIKEQSSFKNIMLDVVKSNNELQKQMIEICKNTTIITQNNNINSHNKTFNLMFFLNEQCKDAMNISEFVESFDLQLEDLESVGNLGYVEGITKLMVDKLNSMDLYKRPIHCSDAKREIIYIKDDNKWEKETRDYPKLRRAIKHISFKNMKLAPLWSDTYPDSKSSESNLNDVYMKIIIQSTGGSGDIAISENKIIRRIAKEFVIDKHLIMSQR
jgi:hypothetical protein